MKRWVCPPRPGLSNTFNYESMNTQSLTKVSSKTKSQTAITIVLTALIVMVPFLTFLTFYDISFTDENPFSNAKFNNELWVKTDFSGILLGILAAAAAIVAVAFTVTQLLMENVSQKYTPKIHEFLLEYVNPNRPFFILITVIGICARLVLFIDLLEPAIFLLVISLLVDTFLVGLLLFTQNYYDLFKVINPLSLIDLMSDKVIKNLEGDNNENTK